MQLTAKSAFYLFVQAAKRGFLFPRAPLPADLYGSHTDFFYRRQDAHSELSW